jgi:hypothetical protein
MRPHSPLKGWINLMWVDGWFQEEKILRFRPKILCVHRVDLNEMFMHYICLPHALPYYFKILSVYIMKLFILLTWMKERTIFHSFWCTQFICYISQFLFACPLTWIFDSYVLYDMLHESWTCFPLLNSDFFTFHAIIILFWQFEK